MSVEYDRHQKSLWTILHESVPSIGQSTKALHSSILSLANLVQQILNRYKLGPKDQRNLFYRNEELKKSRK